MPRYTQPYMVGGCQIRTNKFAVRPGELILAQNVSSEILGSWKTRKGFTQTGSTLQADKNITGLFGDMTSGGKHSAVVDNSGGTSSVLKSLTGVTWSNVTGATSMPADVNANFLSYLDQTYIVGKNSSNTYATTATVKGTTYGTESSFPKAAYEEVFYDQLYLANCEVDGVRYPSRIYYSSFPTYSAGWSITFTTATDYLSANTNDGDELMGMAKSYGQLLALKQFSIFAIDSNQNMLPVDGTGTTSPRSIVSDDDKNVYFHHFSAKKKGIFRWDGTGAKKISRPIDPFIEGSSGDGVVGGINNDHIYQYIGDVTLDADIAAYYGLEASFANVLLDYSIMDDFWTIHILPVDIRVMAPYNGDLYFGDNTGKVYQWGLGTSDDNTNIEAIVCTHNFYGQASQEFNKRKTFEEIVINMHKQNLGRAFYSVDNGDWKPLGQLKNKVNLFTISAKGYGIKLKVSSNYSEYIFEGIEISYKFEDAIRSE